MAGIYSMLNHHDTNGKESLRRLWEPGPGIAEVLSGREADILFCSRDFFMSIINIKGNVHK